MLLVFFRERRDGAQLRDELDTGVDDALERLVGLKLPVNPSLYRYKFQKHVHHHEQECLHGSALLRLHSALHPPPYVSEDRLHGSHYLSFIALAN